MQIYASLTFHVHFIIFHGQITSRVQARVHNIYCYELLVRVTIENKIVKSFPSTHPQNKRSSKFTTHAVTIIIFVGIIFCGLGKTISQVYIFVAYLLQSLSYIARIQ